MTLVWLQQNSRPSALDVFDSHTLAELRQALALVPRALALGRAEEADPPASCRGDEDEEESGRNGAVIAPPPAVAAVVASGLAP